METLTLDEAIALSCKILKSVMEEKISGSNVQVATITPENGYQMISDEKLAQVVAGLV